MSSNEVLANQVNVPSAQHSDNISYHSEISRKRRNFNKILYAYVPIDICCLLAGFSIAASLAIAFSAFLNRHYPLISAGHMVMHSTQMLTIAAGVILWFHHTGHYSVRNNFWLEVTKVVNALLFAAMVDGFLQFTVKGDFSRLMLMSGWIIAALLIIVSRMALRKILMKRGLWQVPTLLVGGGTTAKDTFAAFESDPSLGYKVVERISNLPMAFLQAGRSWERLCTMYGVDYVVIALDGKELEQADQPIAQLIRESVPFSVSPPRLNLPVLDMIPQYFFNHDVKLLTRHSGLEEPLSRFIKRSFDFVVSCITLLFLSPILLLIALMVKLDGGPAFYGHKRIGQDGKTFSCLKFRSMVAGDNKKILQDYLDNNPEARIEWQETQKLKDDPRVTRLGKLLRKTSMDELPQILNVLKGEMSLIGPRPIVQDELKKYGSDIAYYYRVRPGITGLWQASGRNDVSYTQRVQMDSWYVRNWSLWHDIAILFKTIPALFNRSGAY